MRQQAHRLSNSISHNVATDDLTYWNYKALQYAICGVVKNGKHKKVEPDQILRNLKLFENNSKKVLTVKADKKEIRSYMYNDITVTDIKTKETYKFDNTKEVAKFLNESTSSVCYYIKGGYIYRKKYTLTAGIKNERVNSGCDTKQIQVTNLITLHKEILPSVTEAAKYMLCTPGAISYAARHTGVVKKIWQVRYIEE